MRCKRDEGGLSPWASVRCSGETVLERSGRQGRCYLQGSGRELRPLPCLEFYLNSPENTGPEDLVTDIYLPLEAC